MRRWPILLGLAALALAGCGGSSSTSSSTSTRASTSAASSSVASPTTATSATPPASTTTSTSSASTSSSTKITTKITTVGQPPQTTANTTGPPAGAGQNARVPASFTLRSGGVLSPSNVSSPAFIAIRLTIQSLDARAHLVEIRTPLHHSLTVPAHGHATVQIPGQRQGNYSIAVDGITRGALVIGGEPGP